MSALVQQFCKTCHVCQLTKKKRRKYGHLPTHEPELTPWKRVDVDLVGPYTVTSEGKNYSLRALTMIDPATKWFEIVEVAQPTSDCVVEAFNDTWLSRYPRPQYIGFDNGSEFKGAFEEMTHNFGLQVRRSTEYNPQSNGIIERVHDTLNNMLRTFELEKCQLNEREPWRPFLSAAAYAIRSTYHTTLSATPGQVVFGRDMLLPITFKANWARIETQKRSDIARNNAR
jgi:hypothetical protein